MVDAREVALQAQKEFHEEQFKQAVAQEKRRLALRKSFWARWFPWRLRVERRDMPFRERETQVWYHVRKLRELGCVVKDQQRFGDMIVERTGCK